MYTLYDMRSTSRESLGGGFRCREAAELFAAALGIARADALIIGTDPLRADARERTLYVEATRRLHALADREAEVTAREARLERAVASMEAAGLLPREAA